MSCMGFTKVTELPLLLHRVEPDPFLDPTWGDRADLTTALLVEPVDPDELRARSRHAELAA
jgi:hypothetical protein